MVAEQILLDLTTLGVSNPMVQAVIVGGVRSVLGWAENAFRDGKVSAYELKQLGETIVRILPQALGLTALVGPAGIVGAMVTDYLLVKYLKK